MSTLLPKHLHFQGLNPGETVQIFLRSHPVVLWTKLGTMMLLGFIPAVIWILLVSLTEVLDDPQSVLRLAVILVFSLFYLYWVRLLFTAWLDYYLDVWVVTTHRILNVVQDGLFNRRVSEHLLSQIQDVTTETKGMWQTFLRFGNIRIQTAAEVSQIIFRSVKHPELIAKRIGELQAEAVAREHNAPDDVYGRFTAPIDQHSQSQASRS